MNEPTQHQLQMQDGKDLAIVGVVFLCAAYGLYRLYRSPRFRVLAIVLIVLAVLVLPPFIYFELTFRG